MHVNGFLHKTLSSVMHSKRLFTLSFLVEGLLCSKKLSVTELGRGMKTCITERSAIRKADRFIGNKEIHKKKNLGNRKIEKNFLLTLHRWMPPKTKPIVVTDAGFHNEWFKALQSLNWDYIGRVRGLKICYQKGLVALL